MDEDENEMEDVVVPNEDVDTMMMLGKHYILNYIMKQAAKPLKGIPYHYKDINGRTKEMGTGMQGRNQIY